MEALNLNYLTEVFADTSQMSREEWLNTRRFGIGGSEASIIRGYLLLQPSVTCSMTKPERNRCKQIQKKRTGWQRLWETDWKN